MELGRSKSCYDELFIGHSPLGMFTLGAFQIVFNLVIAALAFHHNVLTSAVSKQNYLSYVLPVYLSAVLLVILIGLFVGIDNVIGLYEQKYIASVLKWFILRSLSEGLSIFLCHSGIGIKSFRNSVIGGLVWSSCNSIVLGVSYYCVANRSIFDAMVLFVVSSLIAYYALMWLLPLHWLHRRPALYSYAIGSMLVLIAQLVVSTAYFSNKSDEDVSCSVDLIFSVGVFFQLILILRAFYQDSMFWQG